MKHEIEPRGPRNSAERAMQVYIDVASHPAVVACKTSGTWRMHWSVFDEMFDEIYILHPESVRRTIFDYVRIALGVIGIEAEELPKQVQRRKRGRRPRVEAPVLVQHDARAAPADRCSWCDASMGSDFHDAACPLHVSQSMEPRPKRLAFTSIEEKSAPDPADNRDVYGRHPYELDGTDGGD